MNTILDLLGSYLIGGILILGVLGLIFFFSTRSQSSKLNEISQTTISETGKIIEYDFNVLGYRVESGNKITSIGNNAISFRADIDNDGVVDSVSYAVIIRNNTKVLRRTVSNLAVKSWDLPVKNASITSVDSLGLATNSVTAVKAIEFSIQLEPVSAGNDLPGSYWKRKFFPKNL